LHRCAQAGDDHALWFCFSGFGRYFLRVGAPRRRWRLPGSLMSVVP
jgi:hypothetical protein